MTTDRNMTERDNRIVVEWFQKYKYAFIENIEKAFFPHQQYSYNIARTRLNRLKENGYIKTYRDEYTNRNIYIYDEEKIKPPSYHRMVLLNILSEILYMGFNVEKFEIEKSWCDRKYFSDAFVQFTVDNLGNDKGQRIYLFVEIQTSNNYHRLEKYDEIFNTGEVQKYIGKDYFPRVLLVSDRKLKNFRNMQM